MYHTILFDLDGTLTDPGVGITNSVMYALERLGLEVPPREELYHFIGPPLRESFREFYGMNVVQAEEAVRLFRVYFAEKGLYENELYDGVLPMLAQLYNAGARLVLATSKPEKWARIIVKSFGIDRYIREIAGATMDQTRTKKGEVIAYALNSFSVDRSSVVMVGDRKHDVLGGLENNIPAIGVTYGYGDRAELESAGALAVADSPDALLKLLLGGTM